MPVFGSVVLCVWLYLLQAMSAAGCGEETAAALSSKRGCRQAFFGGGRNSSLLSFLTILSLFGGKAPETLVRPNFCGTPALRNVLPASTLMPHVQPALIDLQCTFWKGLQPSAGSQGTKGTPRSPAFSTSEG